MADLDSSFKVTDEYPALNLDSLSYTTATRAPFDRPTFQGRVLALMCWHEHPAPAS